MRVLLAGGGSAGHTSPMIAVAQALTLLDSSVEVTFVGTARGLENRVVPAAGYPLELIPPVPLPRRVSTDLLRVPWRLRAAVSATQAVLDRVRPGVVAGFGGYVSVPVYVAARRRRIPLVIHEQNALPGIANRFGARVCTTNVATSFPDTPLPHARYVGLPVRRAISHLDRADLGPLARDRFGLRQDLPTLLVTGGSQGARRLNQAVAGAAGALAEAGVQVLHVAGPAGAVELPERADSAPPYVVVDFVEAMELAYAAADATVCRAGASSVVEALLVGLPAVFVPLPIGNGEQARNAAAAVRAGAALQVEDAALTSGWVAEHVPTLLTDPDRLARMRRAGAGLSPADADERLAQMMLEAAS